MIVFHTLVVSASVHMAHPLPSDKIQKRVRKFLHITTQTLWKASQKGIATFVNKVSPLWYKNILFTCTVYLTRANYLQMSFIKLINNGLCLRYLLQLWGGPVHRETHTIMQHIHVLKTVNLFTLVYIKSTKKTKIGAMTASMNASYE